MIYSKVLCHKIIDDKDRHGTLSYNKAIKTTMEQGDCIKQAVIDQEYFAFFKPEMCVPEYVIFFN